jgi:hypothetical protein
MLLLKWSKIILKDPKGVDIFWAQSNISLRRVWSNQRGNQNLYIEEEQTTQWPKEKVQKDKQRPTKHTHKTKDWVTQTPVKTGGELRCSRRVSSSCSTSGTRRVNLVTNPVISREWEKDREVFTTSGTYPWSLSKNFISIRHGVSLSSRS